MQVVLKTIAVTVGVGMLLAIAGGGHVRMPCCVILPVVFVAVFAGWANQSKSRTRGRILRRPWVRTRCPRCRHQLPQDRADIRYCPVCGARLFDE